MKVQEITVMVQVSAPDVRPGDKKWSEVFDSVAKELVSRRSQGYVCWQIDDEKISHCQKSRMRKYISELLEGGTLVSWARESAAVHMYDGLPSPGQYARYRSLWCKRLAKQFRKAGL